MDMPFPPPGGAGGAPPPMPHGPAGTGPAAMSSPAPGSAKQGMTAVTAGLELLQKALPQLPMGSKIHQSVMKAISDIGKHMAEEGGGQDKAALMQQLVELARNAKVNPNAQAALPGAGPGGPPPPMMPPGPPGAPPGM